VRVETARLDARTVDVVARRRECCELLSRHVHAPLRCRVDVGNIDEGIRGEQRDVDDCRCSGNRGGTGRSNRGGARGGNDGCQLLVRGIETLEAFRGSLGGVRIFVRMQAFGERAIGVLELVQRGVWLQAERLIKVLVAIGTHHPPFQARGSDESPQSKVKRIRIAATNSPMSGLGWFTQSPAIHHNLHSVDYVDRSTGRRVDGSLTFAGPFVLSKCVARSKHVQIGLFYQPPAPAAILAVRIAQILGLVLFDRLTALGGDCLLRLCTSRLARIAIKALADALLVLAILGGAMTLAGDRPCFAVARLCIGCVGLSMRSQLTSSVASCVRRRSTLVHDIVVSAGIWSRYLVSRVVVGARAQVSLLNQGRRADKHVECQSNIRNSSGPSQRWMPFSRGFKRFCTGSCASESMGGVEGWKPRFVRVAASEAGLPQLATTV
jgi:hypothetical protein